MPQSYLLWFCFNFQGNKGRPLIKYNKKNIINSIVFYTYIYIRLWSCCVFVNNVTAQNNNKGECSFQFTKRLFTIRTNTFQLKIDMNGIFWFQIKTHVWNGVKILDKIWRNCFCGKYYMIFLHLWCKDIDLVLISDATLTSQFLPSKSYIAQLIDLFRPNFIWKCLECN